ncbi:hypothetical protein P9112_000716 [Eukaryota sp. TZLM1-RC]
MNQSAVEFTLNLFNSGEESNVHDLKRSLAKSASHKRSGKCSLLFTIRRVSVLFWPNYPLRRLTSSLVWTRMELVWTRMKLLFIHLLHLKLIYVLLLFTSKKAKLYLLTST